MRRGTSTGWRFVWQRDYPDSSRFVLSLCKTTGTRVRRMSSLQDGRKSLKDTLRT